jgi:hypothetical protein
MPRCGVTARVQRVERLGTAKDCAAARGAALDRTVELADDDTSNGGALVSTWGMRQRRHAEDGSLASLKIEPKQTANQELALAA